MNEKNMTPRAQQVLAYAHKKTRELGHPGVGPEHLLLGILTLEVGSAYSVLTQLGFTKEKTLTKLLEVEGIGEIKPKTTGYTEESFQAIRFAEEEEKLLKHTYLGSEHLLLGLARTVRGAAFLQKCSPSPDIVNLVHSSVMKEIREREREKQSDVGAGKTDESERDSKTDVDPAELNEVLEKAQKTLYTQYDVIGVGSGNKKACCYFKDITSIPAVIGETEIKLTPNVAAVLMASGGTSLERRERLIVEALAALGKRSS